MSKTRKRKMSRYAAKQFIPLPPELANQPAEPDTKEDKKEEETLIEKTTQSMDRTVATPKPVEDVQVENPEVAPEDEAAWGTLDDFNHDRAQESEKRVRPGMVFWYNLEPGVYKRTTHLRTSHGVTYQDFRILGRRPWVVLTEVDESFHSVTIAPFTTGKFGPDTKTAVPVTIAGKPAVCIMSQAQPVNVNELVDYFTWLTSDVMNGLVSKWLEYIGVTSQVVTQYATKADALSQVETILAGLIDSRIERVRVEQDKFTDKDVSTVLDKTLSLLKSRCDNIIQEASAKKDVPIVQPDEKKEEQESSKDSLDVEMPAVEKSLQKFYEKYPEMKDPMTWPSAKKSVVQETPDKKPSRPKYPSYDKSTDSQFINGVLDKGLDTKGKPRATVKWNVQLAQQYIYDVSAMSESAVAKKWDMSPKGVVSMVYRLRKKFNL